MKIAPLYFKKTLNLPFFQILLLLSLNWTSLGFALPLPSYDFSIYSGPDKLLLPSANDDRFEKVQTVLQALQVPSEPSPVDLYELDLFQNVQTKKNFDAILPYVDPNHNLRRYADWNDEGISVYQDRDTKQILDFSIAFKKNGDEKISDPKKLLSFLTRTHRSNQKPLNGIRIALDPGHMGSDPCGKGWDLVTGKFVSVNGRCLSEGAMALQVALILGDQLERLGATVLLTRMENTSVSDKDMASMDLTQYINEELRQSTDTPWFDLGLKKFKNKDSLISFFKNNPEVIKIKNGSLRGHYFIFHEDLSARARMINAFKPDLTLILHFDASLRDQLQTAGNFVRAFIPGNIKGQELSTREQRASSTRTLVDGMRFSESLRFSRFVTSALSNELRVPLKKDPTDIGAIKVVDGVYARNLALNRSVTQGVISYLELMYYNYAPEYELLWKKDRKTLVEINGRQIELTHSSRIDDIAQGLTQGVLDYVYSTP